MEEEFRELEIGGMIYRVSNLGRIFGKRGELKQRLNRDGYLDVTVGKTIIERLEKFIGLL